MNKHEAKMQFANCAALAATFYNVFNPTLTAKMKPHVLIKLYSM